MNDLLCDILHLAQTLELQVLVHIEIIVVKDNNVKYYVDKM